MILGLDPSTKVTAYCIYNPAPKKILKVGVFRSPKGLKGTEAAVAMCRILPLGLHSLGHSYFLDKAVIEGQNDHAGGKKSIRPIDIMRLALVAGAAIGCVNAIDIVVPSPSEWKGSISKQAKQGHILRDLGIAFEKRGTAKDGYCRPLPMSLHLIPGGDVVRYITDWKEIVDAMGLAVWGAKECQKAERHERIKLAVKERKKLL